MSTKIKSVPHKGFNVLTEQRYLAIRHLKNGGIEFAVACVKIAPNKLVSNNKNEILWRICTKKWGHNPPALLIAEYITKTNIYSLNQMLKMNPYAYEIHFYESDPDNPNAHSCREVFMISDKDMLKSRVDELKNSAEAFGEMSYADMKNLQNI